MTKNRDKALEKRYEKLDRTMQMYFKERTFIEVWDRNVVKAKEYNKGRKWYQNKCNVPPYYHAAPIKMPMFFAIPPSTHPQYKEAEALIEDYLEGPTI